MFMMERTLKTRQDGAIYVGSWAGDKKQGKRVMTWPDKKVCDGDWFNDKAEGKEKMT